MIAKPPPLDTGVHEKLVVSQDLLSSNAPLFILLENLLIIKKVKKLIKANIDKKLASIDSVPI